MKVILFVLLVSPIAAKRHIYFVARSENVASPPFFGTIQGCVDHAVRVTRAEMNEGTVVKEMSEAAVLAKLDKDLESLEAARRKSSR